MEHYIWGWKQLELRVLCDEICDKQNATAIYHGLIRSGIKSIGDLKDCDLRTLRGRHFGEMRMEFVNEMKIIIEDEEKIQSIMEKDNDVMRLRNDTELYERVISLDEAGYSTREIAEILGLRETTLRIIT